VAFAKPLAVIESHDGEERLMPIRDITSVLLRQMALVGLAVSVLCGVLVLVNRWVRRS
jgi:hypothetical protein